MEQPRFVDCVVRHIGVAVVAAALPAIADAQSTGYPSKPVRIIVPFSAGSPVEIPARPVAQRLAEAMGQQFLIDNRTGASGTIGTELVVRAPRDGYTLLWTNCSHSSNPSYYKKLPYDTLADLTPVTQSNVTYGNMLVVHPSVPARSVKEFIALAKSVPGKLNYASAGVGSPPHVTGALFAAVTGIQIAHVPYKGTSVAFTDVLAGHVEVMFASPTYVYPYIRTGRVRGLGMGGPRRTPILPDIPTFQETGLAGLTGFDVTCYHGVFFPVGVPAEIVRRLNAEIAKVLTVPEVRKYYADNGLIPVGNSPEEFAEFLAKDIAHQASIAKQIGLQPQ